MHLGVITPHYYHADKYSQAKANFILLSLSGPGWIFLAVAIYHLAVSIKPLFILGVLLAFIYLSSIITLLKHNKWMGDSSTENGRRLKIFFNGLSFSGVGGSAPGG